MGKKRFDSGAIKALFEEVGGFLENANVVMMVGGSAMSVRGALQALEMCILSWKSTLGMNGQIFTRILSREGARVRANLMDIGREDGQ